MTMKTSQENYIFRNTDFCTSTGDGLALSLKKYPTAKNSDQLKYLSPLPILENAEFAYTRQSLFDKHVNFCLP